MLHGIGGAVMHPNKSSIKSMYPKQALFSLYFHNCSKSHLDILYQVFSQKWCFFYQILSIDKNKQMSKCNSFFIFCFFFIYIKRWHVYTTWTFFESDKTCWHMQLSLQNTAEVFKHVPDFPCTFVNLIFLNHLFTCLWFDLNKELF